MDELKLDVLIPKSPELQSRIIQHRIEREEKHAEYEWK